MRNVKAKSVKATNLLPISQIPITKERVNFIKQLFQGTKKDPSKIAYKEQKTEVIDHNVKNFIKKAEKIETRLSKLLRSSDKRGLKAKVENQKEILERLREMLENLKVSYRDYKLNIIEKNRKLMEENARKTNELIRNVQYFLGNQVNESLAVVKRI